MGCEGYSLEGGLLRKIATMRSFLGLALIISLMVMDSYAADNQLTCTMCVDVVTDIDNWITSDKTEEEILNFFNEICLAADQLFPGLGATCTDFLFNLGPGIINSLVNENLNPTEVCTGLTLCP